MNGSLRTHSPGRGLRILRVLGWTGVASMLALALIGPGAGVVAAAEPGSPEYLPNSGHTSNTGGLTPTMGTAAMSCDGSTVGGLFGSFTLSGTGGAGAYVVVYLTPNDGSNADPADVEDNEVQVSIDGLSGTVPFSVPITTPFTATKGGILAVFAKDVGGAVFHSKSNSLNCGEATTTTSSTPSTTQSTASTTQSTTASTTQSTASTTQSTASTTQSTTASTTQSTASTTQSTSQSTTQSTSQSTTASTTQSTASTTQSTSQSTTASTTQSTASTTQSTSQSTTASTTQSTQSTASTTATTQTTTTQPSTTTTQTRETTTATTTSQPSTTTTATTPTTSTSSTPSGEVGGVQATPVVTLPPTDTLSTSTPPASDGWRVILVAMAGLLALLLLLMPAPKEARRAIKK